MDCQTLLFSVLLVVLCFIGNCHSQDDDVPKYQCFDCTYFKGTAEMNPNCYEPASSAAIREDCEFCSMRVYRNANHTYIRRFCTRACKDGQYAVNYQDLRNVPATQYCCQGNLCNTGSGAAALHLTLTTLWIALASCGVWAILTRLR